ncbi:hypothetical protein CICLE_v10013803mg [Citrus x clementina]|uniref:Metallothionein-like protein n=1 Tax=Citrus clementina TaxID=85681 RepID=V4SRP5_CITCL|nr:hypothetical protein CICLE_v10013803mg [Citrus x clementina]
MSCCGRNCGRNCGCGSSCKCGSDYNVCRMYPDLSYSENPTTTTDILVLGDAYAKMNYEVSEMGFGAEGDCKCKFYKNFFLN